MKTLLLMLLLHVNVSTIPEFLSKEYLEEKVMELDGHYLMDNEVRVVDKEKWIVELNGIRYKVLRISRPVCDLIHLSYFPEKSKEIKPLKRSQYLY